MYTNRLLLKLPLLYSEYYTQKDSHMGKSETSLPPRIMFTLL